MINKDTDSKPDYFFQKFQISGFCKLNDSHKCCVLTSETMLVIIQNVRFSKVAHKTMIHNIFKNFREARQDLDKLVIG